MPALATTSSKQSGLNRSAILMRALGAKAANVWSQLSPDEARRLSAEMESLPETVATESGILTKYVDAMQTSKPSPSQTRGSIWSRLSQLEGADLAQLIEHESPQVIALILSKLEPHAAAQTVRVLPRPLATDALKRLLHLGDIHPKTMSAVSEALTHMADAAQSTSPRGGHAQVAQILDRMDQASEQSLLSALDSAEPGAGEKVRALMFTFDDLASLDPASLQTILVNVDRAVLTIALKDASEPVEQAFFQNITQRAGDLLRDDIATLGPVRRSDIETARAEILAIARTLVKRGDILTQSPDDELVE